MEEYKQNWIKDLALTIKSMGIKKKNCLIILNKVNKLINEAENRGIQNLINKMNDDSEWLNDRFISVMKGGETERNLHLARKAEEFLNAPIEEIGNGQDDYNETI